MEKIDYTVFCSNLSRRYSKSFDQRNDAKAFYDRACQNWSEVYMVKSHYKLNSKGTTWISTNTQYLYYNTKNCATLIKASAEYRNFARQ